MESASNTEGEFSSTKQDHQMHRGNAQLMEGRGTGLALGPPDAKNTMTSTSPSTSNTMDAPGFNKHMDQQKAGVHDGRRSSDTSPAKHTKMASADPQRSAQQYSSTSSREQQNAAGSAGRLEKTRPEDTDVGPGDMIPGEDRSVMKTRDGGIQKKRASGSNLGTQDVAGFYPNLENFDAIPVAGGIKVGTDVKGSESNLGRKNSGGNARATNAAETRQTERDPANDPSSVDAVVGTSMRSEMPTDRDTQTRQSKTHTHFGTSRDTATHSVAENPAPSIAGEAVASRDFEQARLGQANDAAMPGAISAVGSEHERGAGHPGREHSMQDGSKQNDSRVAGMAGGGDARTVPAAYRQAPFLRTSIPFSEFGDIWEGRRADAETNQKSQHGRYDSGNYADLSSVDKNYNTQRSMAEYSMGHGSSHMPAANLAPEQRTGGRDEAHYNETLARIRGELERKL